MKVTHKHMNLEIIWNKDISQLITISLNQFKEVFMFLDRCYSKSFLESVQNQERQFNGKQKLEKVQLVTEHHL